MRRKLFVFVMMLGLMAVVLTAKTDSGRGASYAMMYGKTGLVTATGDVKYATSSNDDTRTGIYRAQYTSGGKTTTEWC